MKRIVAALLCALCLIMSAASADVIYTLKISASSITLAPGDSRTITWSVEPVNLVEHSVSWQSDNPYVASVDQRGKITAHTAGTTYVRATLETGAQRRITVNVTGNAVTELTIDVQTLQLEVGESAQLSYTINTDADDKRVRWSSDDTSVATVNNGKVTAVGGGVATITLLCVNGMTATVVVYVPSDVKSVKLSPASLELGVGQQETVTAEVLPINARNRVLTWESNDEDIATVDNSGVVTAVSAGECKIRARSENGKYDIINVKVELLPDSITLTPETVVLSRENRVGTLSVGVLPIEAVGCEIVWSSSDEGIVSVENGVVTAQNYGSAEIFAQSKNGLIASAYVYVSEAPEAVRFAVGTYLLPLGGEGVSPQPVFSPSDSMSKGYTIAVEDEKIAYIDDDGLLRSRSVGSTTITLTTEEGLSCSADVRVYEDVKNLYTTESRISLKQYEMRPINFYSETGRAFTGNVSARSDDENVCVYIGGYIYARGVGSAQITFSNPGTSAACTVTVTVSENEAYPTRVIALTFDNGPDQYTEEILAVLNKYNISATFFLLGQNIEAYPAKAALFKDSPHELGNHTYDNTSLAALSVASAASSIEKTDKLAQSYIGRKLTLLRAPDALLPDTLLSSMLDTRRFVGRGYDMSDALGQRNSYDISELALQKAYNTCVLTFHDSGRHTAEALDMLIPELLKQGYRFLTVSELISYTGFESGIFSTVP